MVDQVRDLQPADNEKRSDRDARATTGSTVPGSRRSSSGSLSCRMQDPKSRCHRCSILKAGCGPRGKHRVRLVALIWVLCPSASTRKGPTIPLSGTNAVYTRPGIGSETAGVGLTAGPITSVAADNSVGELVGDGREIPRNREFFFLDGSRRESAGVKRGGQHQEEASCG